MFPALDHLSFVIFVAISLILTEIGSKIVCSWGNTTGEIHVAVPTMAHQHLARSSHAGSVVNLVGRYVILMALVAHFAGFAPTFLCCSLILLWVLTTLYFQNSRKVQWCQRCPKRHRHFIVPGGVNMAPWMAKHLRRQESSHFNSKKKKNEQNYKKNTETQRRVEF